MTCHSITYSMARQGRLKSHGTTAEPKQRSQSHISILSLFSLVFFVVDELLTLLFSMFEISISKGFVSS